VKWPGLKTDDLPTCNADVKNGGAIPPLPHMTSWHSAKLIKNRDNFIFYVIVHYNYKHSDGAKLLILFRPTEGRGKIFLFSVESRQSLEHIQPVLG
jgi:hypothetical protein